MPEKNPLPIKETNAKEGWELLQKKDSRKKKNRKDLTQMEVEREDLEIYLDGFDGK